MMLDVKMASLESLYSRDPLLDVESYQELVNSISLMKCIMIGESDIRAGRVIGHEEMKKRIAIVLD